MKKHKLLMTILGTTIPYVSTWALPEAGQVISGQAVINSSASSMVIQQSSNQAVINWHAFNIDAGETVNFQQPSASSITINRINSANGASNIHGSLTANGQILLLNSAGVLFGPSAQVNVGSIVASTLDLDIDAYNQTGHIQLIPHSTAASGLIGGINNEGNINVAESGMAAFVAPNVSNSGVIHAQLGHVQLSSGDHFTVDLFGDNLINFTVPDTIMNPAHYSVEQHGQIYAHGGTIVLSTPIANQIVSNVISMDGVMQADSIGLKDGKIVLNANENGFLSFKSGSEIYAASGHVEAKAGMITMEPNTLINVSSLEGNAGEVYIGGLSNGELISEKDFNARTVIMGPGSSILANAGVDGNGGKIVVWSKDVTHVAGTVHAKGGRDSGNNGSVQIGGSGQVDTNLADIFPTSNTTPNPTDPNPTDPTNPGTGNGTTTPPANTETAPPTGNNSKLDSLPESTGNQITNNYSAVNHAADAHKNESSNTTLSSDVEDHTSNVTNNEGGADKDGDGYPDKVISTDSGSLDIQPFEFSTGGASEAEE